MAGLIPRTIREAVKKTIDQAGLGRTVAVHAYAPTVDPDAVSQYPCILIGWADPANYRLTFGAQGIASLPLELEIRTQSADGISAEMALDDLLAAGTGSGSSIWDALDTDRTLGGVVTAATTLVMSSPPRPQGDGRWSASLVLTAHAARS
jgi:hypothetical protein